MMRPISQYLTEFRPAGLPAPPLAGIPEMSLLPDFQAGSAFPALEAPGFDAMPDFGAEAAPFADEDSSGEAMGLLEAPAEPAPDLAAALAALEAQHAEAMDAARAQWAAEEGAALAERIAEAFAALEQRLGDALAPMLETFLAKAIRVKALAQLHDTLGTLLGGGETRPVTVSGPADLVAALRDSYGDRPGVGFVEDAAPDVTIALADTRIRSQLRSWARKLDSSLGAQA